ncbi:MAG: hypothetical protein U0822_22230 [Anaerolineae bacterium]
MLRKVLRRSSWAGWFALLLLGTLVSSASAAREAGQPLAPVHLDKPQAPDTPPTVLVSEGFTDWAIGAGLLYWSLDCSPPPRAKPDAPAVPLDDGYLKRMPSRGLGVLGRVRTLVSFPASACDSHTTHIIDSTADNTGIYYYNANAQQVERRSSIPPYDPATPLAIGLPFPTARLVVDDSRVYVAFSGLIIAYGKNGVGAEQLMHDVSATSLAVDDSYLYFVDAAGLWREDKTCFEFLRITCSRDRLAQTNGAHLLYHFFPGSSSGQVVRPPSYSLFWVDTNGPQTIHRYSCSLILPGCSETTIYTAPTDQPWTIGDLATDGESLFFVQSYVYQDCSSVFCINLRNGFLRRLPLSGGGSVPITENIHDAGGRIYTDGDNVYFVSRDANGGSATINRLPVNADALLHNFSVSGWEVTQDIQSLNNDVRLVADKTTYVRVYGSQLSGANANTVGASLIGSQNGSPLPGSPLQPINGPQSLPSCANCFDRTKIPGSWLFQLPDAWTKAGDITLQATIDPRNEYEDPDRLNNTVNQTFTFTTRPPACVVTIPVRTFGPAADNNSANVHMATDILKRLWPVPDVWLFHEDDDIAKQEICFAGPIPYPCFAPYQIPENNTRILTSLTERDTFSDDPDQCDNAHAHTHYIGIVSPTTPTGDPNPLLGTNGSGRLGNDQAWIKLPPDSAIPNDWKGVRAVTLAHEMAHNHDRQHVNCGNPDDPDPNYPYNPCMLDDRSLTNPVTHFGFDVASQSPIAPNAAQDIMSYTCFGTPACGAGAKPRWISDYTFSALFDAVPDALNDQIGRAATGQGNPDAAAKLAAAANVVMITGVVTPTTNAGALNYAWVFPQSGLGASARQKWQALAAPTVAEAGLASGASSQPRDSSSFHLRLAAADGSQLDDRVVTPIDNDIHEAAGFQAADPTAAKSFALTFPAPNGVVAELDLMEGATVLASLRPGPAAPTVSILKPAAGEAFDTSMTIQWRASDPDAADRLLYTVQYSPDDGRSWRALVTGLPGPPDSDVVTLSLPSLSGIPGGETALIRVAASDGYHTALATSGVFRVPNRPPQATILRPFAGQTLPPEQAVVLRGAASDAEDGGEPADRLSWAVDGAGVGAGPQTEVAGLAPGAHTLTFTARDANGQTSTAQETLNVDWLRIPAGQPPTLDGGCDDAAYAAGVTVPLVPYSDGSQAVVHLLHTDTDLWVCFSHLKRGTGVQDDGVALQADVHYQRGNGVPPDHYSLAVGEDGTPSADPANGEAQVIVSATTWDAEMRIPAAGLGGWNHLVGLHLGHYWVGAVGDDYYWPYHAAYDRPSAWATTLIGELPQRLYLPLLERDESLSGR